MKDKKAKKTIQKKLFENYFLVIIISIFLSLTMVYFYTSTIVTKSAKEALSRIGSSVTKELDLELGKANDLQKRMLFSKEFKNLIFTDLNQANLDQESIELQRKFNNSVNLVCGPDDFHNFQMNFFCANGNYVGIGYNPFVRKMQEQDIKELLEWDTILRMDGKKLISIPYQTMWGNRDTYVISMYRSFSKNNEMQPSAILETQIRYNILEKVIEHASFESDGRKIIIYDSTGQVIYPLEEMETPVQFYISRTQEEKKEEFIQMYQNPYTKKKEVLSCATSELTDWRILVIQSRESFSRPLMELVRFILLTGLCVVCLTMAITYRISKQLSNPIRSIHNRMKEFKLEKRGEQKIETLNSNILEIEELNQVFNQMQEQLYESADTIVSVRTHELQAKMMAMQAQMNPHFLYNTLAIIKILGKEGKNDQVIEMCTDLSKMLRYISDSAPTPVPMEKELDYTVSYLKLMKIRHQDSLIYQLDIPSEMNKVEIPRLIIQPLVENCMKYGVNVYPPWKVRISGEIQNGHWKIRVSDNGLGISKERKEELQERISSMKLQGSIVAAQIDGMGLINIYARLKLMYGLDAVFEIGESEEGGAQITIGGIYE